MRTHRRGIGRLRMLTLTLTLAGAVVLVQSDVFTAGTSVPATNADTQAQSVTPNGLKDSRCSGITLTALVTGAGNFEGGAANELMLGSAGADVRIRGRDGNDCIIGGAGDDELRGDAGTDICIGGPGTDTIDCETAIAGS